MVHGVAPRQTKVAAFEFHRDHVVGLLAPRAGSGLTIRTSRWLLPAPLHHHNVTTTAVQMGLDATVVASWGRQRPIAAPTTPLQRHTLIRIQR